MRSVASRSYCDNKTRNLCAWEVAWLNANVFWYGVTYYSGCYRSGAQYYSGCYRFAGAQYYSGCYGFGAHNTPAASTTNINYVYLRRIAVKGRFRAWIQFILPLIKLQAWPEMAMSILDQVCICFIYIVMVSLIQYIYIYVF